ncbi:MAG: class I SAM-dependent methyltransferase [Clostridia bacterium]|nr:class I SAM-dependent methyltransferase [Clostridia bacterium]
MAEKAYNALAPYYEQLITSCDYEQWSQYVFTKLKAYSKGKVGCDLACGSGYFTRFLKKNGYSVYGVDCSESMLLEAVRLSNEQQIFVNYQKQDLKNFKSFEKLDFVTVINDGFNYVAQKDLKKSFKSVCSSLKKGGVLMFDVSSSYKLKNILANNLFGEDTDELTYLWFNTLNGDSVKMELTFFIKDGEKYLRKDESHLQYCHEVEDIKNALLEVGFEIVEISGHLGEPLEKTSQRINFIAIKK